MNLKQFDAQWGAYKIASKAGDHVTAAAILRSMNADKLELPEPPRYPTTDCFGRHCSPWQR